MSERTVGAVFGYRLPDEEAMRKFGEALSACARSFSLSGLPPTGYVGRRNGWYPDRPKRRRPSATRGHR